MKVAAVAYRYASDCDIHIHVEEEDIATD